MYNEVASNEVDSDNYDDEKVQHILKLYKQTREKQKEKSEISTNPKVEVQVREII